ncbi:MAG TPA: HEAT repeat domain-containing protein [Candidatus Sulfotelmatobacter sp.]|nr:HEAT repeat domain-containing protein [Candidatus Sulfotelmatobacter sp.]
MKKPWVTLSWLILALVAGGAFLYAILPSEPFATGESSVVKTRQALRQQGFKTDVTNFDFSTSPDMRAREAAIKATSPSRNNPSFLVEPDLMEVATPHSAVVVWQQSALKVPDPEESGKSDMIPWDDFRQFVGAQRTRADAACQAILSGPIAFNLDARAGDFMLLPHLAVLRNLAFLLCGRTILALHDGDHADAWTNLLAATRLVTAWQPEPAKVSHSTRFDIMHLVYDLTWQALQTNDWSDNELAQLQAEWESANFLTNLSEVQAFMGASDVKMFEHDELSSQRPRARFNQMPPPSFNEFLNQALRDPFSLWQQMHSRWSQRAYFHGGMYEDERRLLLFYRDRQVEYRNAIQASTWMQMRQMPGVTTEVFFQPNYPGWGLFENALNMRRMNTRFQGQGASFLGRAAEAETERRIIVTALALERYREKNGAYPDSLQSLAPEFLQAVPVDFMNGQPLHYQASNGGHFLLYSVGLDCVDNGGNLQTNANNIDFYYSGRREQPSPGYDIVWPYPASADQVAAARKKESEAWAEEMAKVQANGQAQEQRAQQDAEEMRQAAMKKLLAEKPSLGQEPVYQGVPLSAWVIKAGQFDYNGAPEDAVAAIRAIGPKAVPFLLEWMPRPGAEQPVDGAPGWDGVEIAWWALGSQGKSAILALAHLLSLPQKTMDDYSVWTESAKAISYLGPDAITPMLTVATNMEGQHFMWELLANFQNLGTNGAPAVPAIVHWANDSDYWVREGVVTALGGIGERPDLAVPVLTNILEHDSNGMVRRDAAGALGSFANDSDAVLPLLSKTLKYPDWQAREGALSGLGKIQNKPGVVVPLIAPFLYADNNVIQRSAAYALRDLGNPAGYRVLLNARNAPSGWPGIGDIIYQVQQEIETTNWEQSPLREARVPGILAAKWSWDTNTAPDEEKMVEYLANTNVTGAGSRTMADLLMPKQVITGNEPEELTYEFPVSYDRTTNNGFCLLLDADTNPASLYAPDSGAAIQDSLRATNGDTLLVWHTIYDPPGKHALQVEWTYVDTNGAEYYGRGPAIAVTTSNFCQFSQDCVTYDVDRGATFHARLPEKNGIYTIECVTTNGQHLKTLSGSTTNGEFNVLWNLVDDNSNRLTGEWFNSIVHVSLPDSGRFQTMRGP